MTAVVSWAGGSGYRGQEKFKIGSTGGFWQFLYHRNNIFSDLPKLPARVLISIFTKFNIKRAILSIF